jgi:hypothetical protein
MPKRTWSVLLVALMACESPTLNLGYSVLPGTGDRDGDAGGGHPDDDPPDSSHEEDRSPALPELDAAPRDAAVADAEPSMPLTTDASELLDAAVPNGAGDASMADGGMRDAGDAGDAGDAAMVRDGGDADAGDASRPPDGTCQKDSDCPLSALSHCHPSLSRCVNCVTSRDCGGNQCEAVTWHCEDHQ